MVGEDWKERLEVRESIRMGVQERMTGAIVRREVGQKGNLAGERGECMDLAWKEV